MLPIFMKLFQIISFSKKITFQVLNIFKHFITYTQINKYNHNLMKNKYFQLKLYLPGLSSAIFRFDLKIF